MIQANGILFYVLVGALEFGFMLYEIYKPIGSSGPPSKRPPSLLALLLNTLWPKMTSLHMINFRCFQSQVLLILQYMKTFQTIVQFQPCDNSLGNALFCSITAHDCASVHKATPIKTWFALEELKWLGQSPDVSPFECLWNELECQLQARSILVQCLYMSSPMFLWLNGYTFPQAHIKNLVESFPRRVEAVVATKKYKGQLYINVHVFYGTFNMLIQVRLVKCLQTFGHVL